MGDFIQISPLRPTGRVRASSSRMSTSITIVGTRPVEAGCVTYSSPELPGPYALVSVMP